MKAWNTLGCKTLLLLLLALTPLSSAQAGNNKWTSLKGNTCLQTNPGRACYHEGFVGWSKIIDMSNCRAVKLEVSAAGSFDPVEAWNSDGQASGFTKFLLTPLDGTTETWAWFEGPVHWFQVLTTTTGEMKVSCE